MNVLDPTTRSFYATAKVWPKGWIIRFNGIEDSHLIVPIERPPLYFKDTLLGALPSI